MICHLGRGCYLAKEDLSNAYKQIRINPSSWPYTGVKLHGKYYFSTYLVFGARSSPGIFERFSSTTEWVARKEGIQHICHYLDDFLILAPPGDIERAHQNHQKFIQLVKALGWVLKDKKRVSPTTKLTYLGIQIDTDNLTMAVPQTKLKEILTRIDKICHTRKITKKNCKNFSANCVMWLVVSKWVAVFYADFLIC